HRARTRRHNGRRIRMTLADLTVDIVAIIGAVAGKRRNRTRNLLQQGIDLRAVIDILAGQLGGNDLSSVGVHPDMELSPGPTHLCGVLLDQPLTGTAKLEPGEGGGQELAARVGRSWRKLHIGVDADTGEIIAAELTGKDVDDGSQVGPLLEQIAGPVASFTGDGAYDRDDVYREVCQRHPDAAVIVPPRSSAVPSATAETAPTKRDRHLQLIAERGRMGWQRASGY